MTTDTDFTVGSLVKARGREWVVLPDSNKEVLLLRPLGGTEDEVTGIYRALETVIPASFAPPDPKQLGDYRSCRLLRDAVRLGFRSSAGPFRSFARLAVEPRPYQLVPLLMALKQEPVRLLIADDVGIGKTVEAGLVARELLDRGEISRLAVLCPPHLAEQWQAELNEKFHIETKLVLSSTVSQLERECRLGQSVFERFPFVIISIDFIKSDRRRDEFLRTCPEFVIVDEAHTCAEAGEGRGSRQQRHQLVKSIAADPQRHLVLVTATPHSGNESAFRSLLALLNKKFAQLPDDLSGRQHEQARRELATYFVQRRRADIRAYMQADTPFPDRLEQEQSYKLSPEYRRLVEKVLRFARETVIDPQDSSKHRQRVRWWSILALLRSIASSPAAAAATLRSRAATADSESEEEANKIGRHTLLDLMDNEATEGIDLVPGSDFEEEQTAEPRVRRRLQEMAREAEALEGAKDEKLQQAIKMVSGMLKDGFQPIVFCRFIPTAEYVARALRERLPKGVQVEAVTGLLPPVEREDRIAELAEHPQRVLVCTDCLSEGINLQEHFNAVIHYDLSWNPTRHEQREGRVDRFGQPRKEVRVVTYYDGSSDSIDQIVLEVLLRKHNSIRKVLGVSVPVPAGSDRVIESILEDRILHGKGGQLGGDQLALPGMEDPRERELSQQWTNASEREKRSRTVFAQETIKVDEVSRELEAMHTAIGSTVDVADFSREALREYGAAVSQNGRGITQIDLKETPRALRDTLSLNKSAIKARFELPINDGEIYLNRTHPFVDGLATYVMDTALDSEGEKSIASRCGVIRTSRVSKRTTLLLTRIRFHLTVQQGGQKRVLLSEDCRIFAFCGSAQNAEWIGDQALINELIEAQPEANTLFQQAQNMLSQVIDNLPLLQPHLEEAAKRCGEELRDAHRRVRAASQMRGVSYYVEPQLPLDVLGIYVYLPKI
ncbi:ATP-dependent helicase HepA [Ktedonobacter sp. SOSP1-85]|uniref:helicase-related protein n=1 Tax=Ktedonobacter sp. SOSP1-85 TaxID=2778367 RepID=UPI00191560AB|nr:helicase-related protein [Ktedonobacter sp. SOSP1-85]GHO76989.1 ATP-dependent helicase HepA [Ktedonobacter sp. SOSP1-85]